MVPFPAFAPEPLGPELVFAEDFDLDLYLLLDAPRIAGPGSLTEIDTLSADWDDEIAGYWAEAGYGPGES